jgi:carboxylesterase
VPASPPSAAFRVPGDPTSARGRTGVLLQHGFTGTPASMRPWADAVAAQGYAVSVPLLPGHGTSWRDLNRTTWAQWYAEVVRSFDELAATVDRVVLGGLSMGGGLALRLAAERPDAVAGLVLVNPAVNIARWDTVLIPLARWLLPSLRGGVESDAKLPVAVEPGYERTPMHATHSMLRGFRDVRRRLPDVVAPLLVFRSVVDHVVDPSSGRMILAGVSSTDVEERLLHDSWHVATLDNDAPEIFEGSLDFLARVTEDSMRGTEAS